MSFRNILLSSILFLTAPAHATSIELELSQGAQAQSQELSADGKFGSSVSTDKKASKSQETEYHWDLSYTHSSIEVKQQSGANIKDNSHDLSFGGSLETPSRLSLGADLDYSKNPEENLQSYGPSLRLGYTHEFGKNKHKAKRQQGKSDPADDDEDDFHPSLGAELSLGYSNYVQSFTSGTRRRIGSPTRPTSGSNEIAKRSTELSLKAAPWSWMSAKVSYTKYSFNKDVSTFLQYLDVHAIGRLSSGMEDALAGFYDHTLAFSFNFYFLDDWELDLEHASSTVIVDDSHSSYDKVMLYVDLNDSWRMGVGAEYSQTDASTATSSNDKTGYLSLSYLF